LNLEFFIAKRLIKGKERKISVSAPIIKIAIAAIAIGIIMMLIAIATGVGLKHKVREKIAAFNGHIQIENYNNNNSEVTIKPILKNQDFYPEFKAVSGVSHVQAVIHKPGIIRTDVTFEGVIAKGVGTDYNWTLLKEYLVDGSLPNYQEKLNEEVLLSQAVANRLQLKVGDTFFTFFLKDENKASQNKKDPLATNIPNQRRFKIVGIYDSGFEELDNLFLFVDIRHLQRMNKWKADQIGKFEVFIDDFDEVEEKSNEIRGAVFSTLDSSTILRKYPKIFEWLGLFDFNIALIIGIMIIVGGINMITALLVLILERTQMIGILKALGSSDWSIRKVFLYNAAYLITIGLLWGNVIGLGLLWLQKQFRWFTFPNPKEYYINYIPVHIDIAAVILLNIGVLLLCMLMLLLPSYIITKITPVKAIKFE